ncbi:TetR/AcrR family transcriptional regulator [Advenella sp. RU8]|uniref:TetR/AcrR family transcriptional regulator n=1 Tax=Advenella sp. RU8 TaxID=3399575 RepID=UPI003AAAF27B
MKLELKNQNSITQNTKERILESAKILLASKGPEGVTVRDIAENSNANVASINYHFGSKDGLINEALLAILGPTNIARKEMILQAKKQYGSTPLPLPVILDVMIRPLVKSEKGTDQSRLFIRVEHYLQTNPLSPYAMFVYENFHQYAKLIIDELKRTLPHLSIGEIAWRYEFARGALLHLLSNIEPGPTRLKMLNPDITWINLENQEAIIQTIASNILGGIGAPTTGINLAAEHD